MISMDRRAVYIIAFVAILAVSALVYLLVSPGMAFFPFVFLFFPIGIFGRSSREKDRSEETEYCPECGYEVEPGEKFCTYCGRMLRRL